MPQDLDVSTIFSTFATTKKHTKGVTSGSRVRFKNEATGVYIDIHRPHPGSIMKEWMVKVFYQHLKNNHLI